MITGKTAGIIFAAIAGLVSSACDNRPPDEKLRAKLPEIKDAMFDDREDRELAKALALVADGADPNVVHSVPEWGYTYTLLGFTIAYGSLQQLSDLLDAGADPNLATDATDLHAPPLCHVYNRLRYEEDGVIEFVELMLDKGADINGCPAIGVAAAYGHEDLVTLLLDRGASLETFVSEREYSFLDPGETVNRPLQAAAFGGNVGILERFLATGIKVAQPDPFIIAAFESLNPAMLARCLELAPPADLAYVYDVVLGLIHAADETYHWSKEMEMLRVMKRAGYGVSEKILEDYRQKYPRHTIETETLAVLQNG